VIAEKNMLALNNNKVTWRYKDSTTKQFVNRCEAAVDFFYGALSNTPYQKAFAVVVIWVCCMAMPNSSSGVFNSG